MFQRIRLWRNQEPETHSDELPITPEWQDQFYSIYVLNGQPERKYFSIVVEEKEVGVCGLKDITDTSANLMISIDPVYRGQGIGRKAIRYLLSYAKNTLGLSKVFGVVNYTNIDGLKFWNKICEENKWIQVMQFGAELI